MTTSLLTLTQTDLTVWVENSTVNLYELNIVSYRSYKGPTAENFRRVRT